MNSHDWGSSFCLCSVHTSLHCIIKLFLTHSYSAYPTLFQFPSAYFPCCCFPWNPLLLFDRSYSKKNSWLQLKKTYQTPWQLYCTHFYHSRSLWFYSFIAVWLSATFPLAQQTHSIFWSIWETNEKTWAIFFLLLLLAWDYSYRSGLRGCFRVFSLTFPSIRSPLSVTATLWTLKDFYEFLSFYLLLSSNCSCPGLPHSSDWLGFYAIFHWTGWLQSYQKSSGRNFCLNTEHWLNGLELFTDSSLTSNYAGIQNRRPHFHPLSARKLTLSSSLCP